MICPSTSTTQVGRNTPAKNGEISNLIGAASGGSLVDKTPTNARQLIENMASNHQQIMFHQKWGN